MTDNDKMVLDIAEETSINFDGDASSNEWLIDFARRLLSAHAARAEPDSYTPEQLYNVLEHTLLPTDFKKRMALLELITALEQPDAAPAQEAQQNAAGHKGSKHDQRV